MPSAVTPPPMPMKAGIEIAIDRGGTFTDCIATNVLGGEDIVVKLLSVDPLNYEDAPTVSPRQFWHHQTTDLIRKVSGGY
jgi:5-oxoprolinase (ATP-hydrolysing)